MTNTKESALAWAKDQLSGNPSLNQIAFVTSQIERNGYMLVFLEDGQNPPKLAIAEAKENGIYSVDITPQGNFIEASFAGQNVRIGPRQEYLSVSSWSADLGDVDFSIGARDKWSDIVGRMKES